MSSQIDVPVNITTVWDGPNGTMFIPQSTITEMMPTIYTDIAVVKAARNGTYTYQATISPKPESEFITSSNETGLATIIVGKCYSKF